MNRPQRGGAFVPKKLESARQIEFVNTFKMYCGPCRLFSIPNEGARGKAQTATLKAMGMWPGAADLVVTWPAQRLCFLEFKQPDEKLRDNQGDFATDMAAIGWPCFRVTNWIEAFEALQGLKAPLKRYYVDGRFELPAHA